MPHEHTSGERLFARYAFSPNDLGFCGPAGAGALAGVARGEDVARGYWTGTAETAGLDRGEFWRRLLAVIGPQAGSYWKHLDEKLATEAAPNHAFHVLGVYPWTRLLVTGRPEPVQVIDSCCIRPGRVIAVEEDGRLEVFAEQLVFRHGKLGLEPTIYTGIESLFVSGFAENDAVALHWGPCAMRSTSQRRRRSPTSWGSKSKR